MSSLFSVAVLLMGVRVWLDIEIMAGD